jgi:hypothetical protein
MPSRRTRLIAVQAASLPALAMDRSALQRRLAETEERIANGERQIAQQRKLVAKLDADGRGAAHAKYLLAGLELLQSARRDSREWLLKQLMRSMTARRFPPPWSVEEPDMKLGQKCFRNSG